MKEKLNTYYSLYQKRWFKIFLGSIWIALIILGLFQVRNIKLDFNFESFFQEDNEDRTFFDQHKSIFGYDNDYVLLIIPADQGIFNHDFLGQVKAWQEEAELISGVEIVNSPLDFKHVVESPLGITAYPLIHYQDNKKLKNDSLRIKDHPLYSNFFDLEGQTMMISIQHDHFDSREKEDLFLKSLNSSLAQSGIDSYQLVGRISAQKAFIENIGNDFALFTSLALLLAGLVLWLIYRSFRLMLIPYLISITALVLCFGLMGYFGISLSILSILLPTIVLFVSTSDAIHLTNSYRALSASGIAPKSLLYASIREVFKPTLLTSITTAIGFASLYTIPNAPIQELGLFAAIAVILAFLVNFIFGPLLLNTKKIERRNEINTKHIIVYILRRRKWILSISCIVLILSIVGISKLRSDAYLLKDLPEGDPVRSSFEYVDDQYGGSKPWELAIKMEGQVRSVWDPSILKTIHAIQLFLTDSLEHSRAVSVVQFVKYANQIQNGGLSKNFSFPTDSIQLSKSISLAKKLFQRSSNIPLVNKEGDYTRILTFIPDWGARKTQSKNSRLITYFNEQLDNNSVSIQLTGTTYLIDKSNEMVSFYLIKGLLLATVFISLILAIYFRSLKMILISLAVNLLPLFITAGVMGLMGVPIKLTSTIIFVVAFGVAVDDTIHFLGAYKRYYQQHKGLWPMIQTFKRTGFSIIVTSLIIISGFSLFILSSFATTYYLGFFLSLSLLMALLTDLLLLPVLLKLRS